MSGFVEAAPSRMRSRRGAALLAALGLLAMGAALLAGSFMAGTAAQRSVESREAALLAGTEVRVAVAEFVSRWSAADDSLGAGAERVIVLGPRVRGSGAVTMTTQLRLRRLSPTRYVVVADCQAGLDDAVLARRRVRVILDRARVADSVAAMTAPVPIARWTLADLY
jgi:hypothetical protein